MLHHALQKHLGSHALQQGSKVDYDWLRFDFANPSAVGEEQLVQIENEVNDKILAGEPVGHVELPLSEARNTGATMLFGEKYCDVVRVVSVGDFSKELCGGTHLDNSALVGIFKIIGEESVAAGTRRITALTGRGAMESIRKVQTIVRQAANWLKVPPEELPGGRPAEPLLEERFARQEPLAIVVASKAAKEIEAFPRKAGKRRAHSPIFAHRTAGP